MSGPGTLFSSDATSSSSTGSGGINYITNPNAETNTSGWAAYGNSAANIPSTGTGGVTTGLTFSRSTVSPLIGTGSFSIVQTNSTNIQGKGVASAFTIDAAYQAQPLGISFNYNASSTFVASNGATAPLNDGTTSTNAGNSDIEVFVYDVTNAKLIYVTPQVITAKGSNNFQFSGSFQPAPNSVSYNLIFHVATASANATGWTFKFDNVLVGPTAFAKGAPLTDLTTTLVFDTIGSGFGTSTNFVSSSKRVGDELYVEGNFISGSVGAGVGYINMPAGYAIDTTKLSSAVDGTLIGIGHDLGGASRALWTRGLALFYDGSDSSKIYWAFTEGGSVGQYPKSGVNGYANTGDGFSFYFRVPIAGWSSNVLMSSDADTRVVAAVVFQNANLAITAGSPIVFNTVTLDTHGGYSAGTYTVPVSGTYSVSCSGFLDTSAPNITINKNGSYYTGLFTSGTATFVAGSAQVPCIAGDTITIVPIGAGGTLNFTAGNAQATLSISKVSGPATIASTETVSARYFSSATTVSGSLATINYATQDWDDHLIYSVGTITIPVSGKYQVNASILVAATFALNSTLILEIQKNGTAVTRNKIFSGGVETNLAVAANDLVRCIPGDTIRVQVSTSGGSPSIVNDNFSNFVSIVRVGNY